LLRGFKQRKLPGIPSDIFGRVPEYQAVWTLGFELKIGSEMSRDYLFSTPCHFSQFKRPRHIEK
jgi:hypothetical protein